MAIVSAAVLAVPSGVHARGDNQSGNTLTVRSRGFAVTGSRVLTPGYVTVQFLNVGGLWNGAAVARIKPGATTAQVRAALPNVDNAPDSKLLRLLGGVGARTEAMTLYLSAGKYLLGDTVSGAKGKTSVAAWFFTVKGTPVSTAPPQAMARVIMVGHTFRMPVVIPGGGGALQVVNSTSASHDMSIFKLARGKTAEDLVSSLQQPNKPGPSVGAVYAGIFDEGAGQSIWLRSDIPRGQYAAISFSVDPTTHRPDFLLGMVKGFAVR